MQYCDFFFLAGGHEKDITALFREFKPQFHVLRTLIMTGHVFYIGACGGAMAAGQFWTPPTVNASSAVEKVGMLNLIQNVDVGVDESAYASTAPEPYIHLTPRVAALVFHDDARAIYIKKSGSIGNGFETEALQRNLDMARAQLWRRASGSSSGDAQRSTGADIGQQTSDATPLAERSVGLSLQRTPRPSDGRTTSRSWHHPIHDTTPLTEELIAPTDQRRDTAR